MRLRLTELNSDTLLRHSKGHSQEQTHSRSSRNSEEISNNGHLPSNGNHGSIVVEHHDIPLANMADPMTLTATETHVPRNQSNGNFGDNLSTLDFSALNTINNASQPSMDPHSLRHVVNGIQGDQPQFLPEDFSSSTLEGTGVSPFSDANLWGASWMSPGPSWLVGYDFDLEALNTSVLSTMDVTQPPPLFQPPQSFHGINSEVQGAETIPRNEYQKKQRFMDDIITRSWFTKTNDTEFEEDPVAGSGQNTPAIAAAERYDVDDTFRTRVSLKLRPSPNHHPLPSANFLVLSHPNFGVFPADVFRPRTCPFKYTSQNSTPSFRSSMVTHFDQIRRTLFSFCRCAQ